MKGLIVQTIKERKNITRKELENIIGCSDRMIRKCIAEECPEIGQSGNGYYYKYTTDDCVKSELQSLARIKKLCERLKRERQYKYDLQHGRSVSDMVRNWIGYTDENLRIGLKQEAL